jgi:hypothetical protein
MILTLAAIPTSSKSSTFKLFLIKSRSSSSSSDKLSELDESPLEISPPEPVLS